MNHVTGHLTTSDEISLFYQVWLPEDHPRAAVLIIHGLGEHSDRYQPYVDYFVPRGYAIYAFDQRGHGRSGGPRGHTDRFERLIDDVDRLVDLIKAEQPDVKRFVLGHSFGSLVALSYGLQRSDRIDGVISSGTALQDALAVPGPLRALAGLFSRLTPSLKFDNGIPNQYLTHDRDILARYERDPLVHRWGTPRLAAEVELVRRQLYEQADHWPLPLLMLHGGDDRICLPVGARRFLEQAPHALVEYHEYAGFYHELHNEPERSIVFQDVEFWFEKQLH
jgi:alpha-beta hydrolase superfamily lysophospholipase